MVDSEKVLRIRTEKTQDDDDSRGVPLSDGLLTLLKEWRDRYRQTMGGYDPDTDWLFPTMKASQISIQQINEIVKDAAEGAGIQDELYTDMSGQTRYEVTAHSLRYSAARGLQDRDVKTRDISTFLGHQRIRTTEGYLSAREKDMQDAIRQSREEGE